MRYRGPTVFPTYLAVKVAADTAVALILLILLYAAADLVEVKAMSGIGGVELLCCYFYKLPSVATLLMPSALGLGVAYETASLYRSGEWEAMEASGISPKTTVLRLLIVSACSIPIASLSVMWIAPLMTARYESHIHRFEKNAPLCFSAWTRHEPAFTREADFVRFNCDNEVDTVIRTGLEGSAVLRFSRIDNHGKAFQNTSEIAVWEKGKGWTSRHNFSENFSTLPKPPGAPAANTLLGQSLTYSELNQAAEDLLQMGISNAPLRAERGLRFSVILACLIVPTFVLVVLTAFRVFRAGHSILLCISLTAVYWLLSAITWNGAARDIWSDVWSAVGAPAGCCVLAGAAVKIKSFIDKFPFH